MDLENGFLYLGKHNQGFSIYEIEEDNSLNLIYSLRSGGEVYGIAQEGDFLYMADLQDGAEVWDISDKTHPELMLTVDEYSPHDIAVDNGFIFLADQDRSFVILEISLGL